MAADAHLHIEGSMDAFALLQMVLQIAEVGMAILLTGILFFRVLIWKQPSRSLPALLSERGERMLAACGLLVFILGGLIGANLGWIRPALTGLWLLLSSMPESNRWDYPRIMKVITACLLLLTFPFTERVVEADSGWLLTNLSLFLHLLASAVWFGGLFGIFKLTSYKTSPPVQIQVLQSLMLRLYGVSILMLMMIAGSGVAVAVVRLQAWNQLFATPYGQLLIIKSMLMIVPIGLLIYRREGLQRRRAAAGHGEAALKKARRQIHNRVRFELSIVVLLVLFSGILASVSLPEVAAKGKPIFWHEMGEEAHMTFFMKHETVTEQSYRVDVWLPAGVGPPTDLKAELISSVEQHGIPLVFKQGGPDPHGFAGFDKYTYEAYGSYWNDLSDSVIVRIEVIDANDNKLLYEKMIER